MSEIDQALQLYIKRKTNDDASIDLFFHGTMNDALDEEFEVYGGADVLVFPAKASDITLDLDDVLLLAKVKVLVSRLGVEPNWSLSEMEAYIRQELADSVSDLQLTMATESR